VFWAVPDEQLSLYQTMDSPMPSPSYTATRRYGRWELPFNVMLHSSRQAAKPRQMNPTPARAKIFRSELKMQRGRSRLGIGALMEISICALLGQSFVTIDLLTSYLIADESKFLF
jgi:hypothetical protein